LSRAPQVAGPVFAALLAVLAAGACSSTSSSVARHGGPDSMGLAIVDCAIKLELQGDPRFFDQVMTTGLERLTQPQSAQAALYSSLEDPDHLLIARPTRGLLVLGPLRAGTYLLKQIGMEREFIETDRFHELEVVRDRVTCKPGIAGVDRIAFLVAPGGVTYVGRMTAASDLRVPEEDARGFQRPLRRVRLVADDRNWSVTWDRSIHHEISAWERMLVSLRKTPWRGPIEQRLEYLKTQQP